MQKKLGDMEEIDMKQINAWLKLKLTSHREGYFNAIQENDLEAMYTSKRREKTRKRKSKLIQTAKYVIEIVFHLVCSCPNLALTLYHSVSHKQVAKIYMKK